MPFSILQRDAAIQSLATQPPELIIIGAGIAGCSAAAHASALGISCLLLERNDFASGASGHSTGLAHAGLRYLAQGRVGYVFHESRERRRLQQMAPHLVKPFHFLYPVYKGDAFPLWQVRIGTAIYDAMTRWDAQLARVPAPRRSQTLSAAWVLERVKSLNPEGLTGAAEYFVDSQVNDSQLTLAFAKAAQARGARIVTHAPLSSIQSLAGGGYCVRFREESSGKIHEVRAPLVLNCAGAWIDDVRHMAGLSGITTTRSRGSHLVIDAITPSPLIFSSPEKGRVFFVLPYGRDASLVGTTDILESGPADKSRPVRHEIAELLELLHRFFPAMPIRVRSMFWGVRPLIRQSGRAADASREHELIREKPDFWLLPGVKLTAGRAAGEQAAQAAYTYLRKSSPQTIDLGILPGGDRAQHLQAYLESNPMWCEAVVPGESWVVGEAAYSAGEEMALTLNDFLWRRSKWPLFQEIPDDSLLKVSKAMASVLGWSADDIQREMQAYQQMRADHRIESL